MRQGFGFAVLGLVLLNRILFDLFAAPLPDEAYYWLWGQRPGLSYYDHAPLQAWLLGVMGQIFGQNLFALRVATWLTTALSVAVIWRATHRYGGDRLAALVIVAASPLLFIFTTMVFHDHLLIALLLLSGFLFLEVFERFATRGELNVRRLYGAAFVLGLAGLSKYNAVFFGLGVAVSIVMVPSLRPLLRQPHLYLAGFLALIMQFPVLYWNWMHDFASFRFNLDQRLSEPRSLGKGFGTLAVFVLIQIALLSPFIVWRMVAFWRQKGGQTDLWRRVSLIMFGVTFGLLGFLCFRGQIHYYWGVVGYLLVFLAPSVSLGSGGWVRAHALYGCLLISLFTVNYTVLPLTALAGKADQESALVYGWDEVSSQVAKAATEGKTDFIIGSHYRIAAQLAFALKRTDIESLAVAGSQFSIWHDPQSRAGQDAIILVDEMVPLGPAITGRFQRMEKLADVPVMRFGHELKRYMIYRGVSYQPQLR